MKTENSAFLATLGGFASLLLWSTTFALVRSLAEQVGSITAATAIHICCGSATLGMLIFSKKRREEVFRLTVKYLCGCGGLFAAYLALIYLAVGWAETRQQVLEVGLLNYLWPVLTLLLSLLLLNKKANWAIVPGTLLALAGVFLVVTQGSQVSWQSLADNFAANPAVYFSALAAAVCWALYSVLTCKWIGDAARGAVSLFLPVTAAVMLVLCCFVDEPRQWTARAVGETLFMGTATYIAYIFWDNAMRRGNVVTVIAASYLAPLLSTVVSCVYLAVAPERGLWLGCGALILGSLLSWQAVSDSATVEEIAVETD